MPRYTHTDLRQQFTSGAFHRGEDCRSQARVRTVEVSADGYLISGKVQGTATNPYAVEARIIPGSGAQPAIAGRCTCPVGFNCKHVVAILLEALASDETGDDTSPFTLGQAPPQTAPNAVLQVWIDALARTAHGATVPPAPQTPERLLYVLRLDRLRNATRASVEILLVRPLSSGAFGKAVRWSGGLQSHARFVTEADRDLLRWLETLRAGQGSVGFGIYPLRGSAGAHVLARMIATGRCHWRSKDTLPLTPGETRVGTPVWRVDTEGRQRLVCLADPGVDEVIPVNPPWFVDIAHAQCGPLKTSLRDAFAEELFTAPELMPEEAETAHAALRRYFSEGSPALPVVFESAGTERPAPVPVLRLFRDRLAVGQAPQWRNGTMHLDLPLAALSFDYAGVLIEARASGEYRNRVSNGTLLRIGRDIEAEARALKTITDCGFSPLAETPSSGIHSRRMRNAFIMKTGGDRDAALLNFSVDRVPALKTAGWRIEMDADYPYRVVESKSDWFADIDSGGSDTDWFGLELGVAVDGRRVNLLPLIVEWLRSERFDRHAPTMAGDKNQVIARLADGRLLPIPHERVQALLTTLIELYDDAPLDDRGRLKLSRAQIGILGALGASLGAPLQWAAPENLRELAQKLSDFSGIQEVTPPAGLHAHLRSYQRAGLNWLSFLREYGFGGILADDMGLGKTVQTLAYVQSEKESGRMDRPVLVVAPTSLMANWRREAQQFTPSLRVLTLHGNTRRENFDRIANHDLVLTTYALLPRDAPFLTAYDYHVVVLDEAQAIKNPKARAAQIARSLKTRQRLCLTGTPMENHLGELWSLFHFVMPGLLGDERRFRSLYRTPIEKHGDDTRRVALARRVAPFMLRRTKEHVAAELPPKTEIIRTVELEGAQRDLYESIRLSMNEKVRLEIARKGLARSQIVILDALLKLRQVCCDPRLVKIGAARQVRTSAKLELLMDMLPALLEEGRRVLLFSQFTSMLGLMEKELISRRIAYALLTGETRDRAAAVDRFQAGEVPLFLISLKAGGTGLNLTAADTVIHYDPWWNPAVERQATDRAHRIGQGKNVFVYKLVTQGTVEEKIAALQLRKQALADSVYGKDSNQAPTLTAEDLETLFSS
ncbi:MAG: DEAD/DEAH box helicase [Acidiferrobacterales bacterium]